MYTKLFTFFLLLSAGSLYGADVPPPPPPPPPDGGMWQTMLTVGVAALFFYLILWRPEQKRRKEAEEMREQMAKGDRVTAMGILGTIVKVKEETVVVAMVDGAKVEFLKAAINEVVPSGKEAKES